LKRDVLFSGTQRGALEIEALGDESGDKRDVKKGGGRISVQAKERVSPY